MNSQLKFELKPVEEKPRRKFIKKSKYDPIIDQFIESNKALVTVDVEGKNANYVRSKLDKRIELRGLQDKLEVSTISGVLYLEKVKS